MAISPLAGKPAPKELLVDVARLERDYFERRPDMSDPNQRVSFGTSGHRGSPLRGTFTEAHILAITQAICDYRRGLGDRGLVDRGQATDGPLYMGKDTHAVSGPAQRTALEVLAANGVETIIQSDDGVTPTPVISRAILVYNHQRQKHLADGIVVTPSHNPPEDGGFKYNPTNGGPADTDVTKWVEDRANELLRAGNAGVNRVPFDRAIKAASTHQEDFVLPYVNDLRNVVDMDAIRSAGLKLGVDPLGVPRCLRQRSRLGPARHRHAHRGIDEPQPLPGGRHPLPARASSTLAGAGRRRQDAGQQQYDRPGRTKARPAVV